MGTTEKKCSRCTRRKPLTQFYRQASTSDGHMSFCKLCDNARKTAYLRARSVRLGKKPQTLTLVARALRAEGKKRCPRCKEVKFHEAFYRSKSQSDGRGSHCIVCVGVISRVKRYTPTKRAYYQKRRRYLRNQHLLRRFGIDLEQYETMLAEQGGVCAVCGAPEHKKMLAVDHNHVTGAVRQLLCSVCNPAIGFLRDDPVRARKIAEYLERHSGG